MNLYALIVAGGSGNRMNSDIPKQFMLLGNKPVLMHTIERFKQYNQQIKIILVLPESQFKYWHELCEGYQFEVVHEVVAGGEERFYSVKNGLDTIREKGIVFIHDGVRPLVSIDTINRCYTTTIEKGNAVPVLPVIESLRKIDNTKNKIVDRRNYVIIQTPQVFHTEEIKMAYNLEYLPTFTDDTSVLENTGVKINLVEGNRENIKITHPIDLTIANILLNT